MDPALDIKIPPEWDAIHTAWEPCERLFTSHGLNRDETYGLCMVARELLENAVKYGRYEGGRPPIELSVEIGPREVTLEVKSPVGVELHDLNEFDRTIQWIRGFQDSFEAYVERLKLASARAFGTGKGGLGIARIAYEGRCAVDFYVDASNTLSVSAVYRR
jgi:hypothetical protein